MICLCLTFPRLSENRAALESCRSWIGLAELRVDRLHADQFDLIPEFMRSLWTEFGISFILTLRLPEDGGSWAFSEEDRVALVAKVVHALGPAAPGGGPLAWVDLEEGRDFADLEGAILATGAGIIRSFHDFTLTPRNLEKRMTAIQEGVPDALRKRFLAKAAVMVRGTRDLLVLVQAARALAQHKFPFILAGMGPFGVPSRILAPVLGSYLTFSSPSAEGRSAAPGHMDPATLAETYGYANLDPSTRIFGIIGNPVLHSRSPAYHNEVFARKGCKAVYVPFQVDDRAAFMELARELDIQGFSVTIPHKEGIRSHLDAEEAAVGQIGACNTVLRKSGTWYGMNTDAPGFFNPLVPLLDSGIQTALVIGAGGAARGVVQALLSAGMKVLIINRTPERAQELAKEFDRWYPGKTDYGPLVGMEDSRLRAYSRLVVQTTSAGMEGSNELTDPLPDYSFDGGELVCDIVYVPERTVFLNRAQAAGCRVMNGMPMFLEQARLQSREFLALLES